MNIRVGTVVYSGKTMKVNPNLVHVATHLIAGVRMTQQRSRQGPGFYCILLNSKGDYVTKLQLLVVYSYYA